METNERTKLNEFSQMEINEKCILDESLATTDSQILDESLATTDSQSNLITEANKDDDAFIKPDFINIRPLKKIISTVTPSKEEENSVCSEKINPSKVKSEKSPSQYVAEKEIPIPYKEPSWSGLPPLSYNFEVIKNGVVIENVPFNKPYIIVGRLSNCDVILEHPSISRFHCVIQYRSEYSKDEPPGLYVYDLDSTHGTFQNKCQLQPKQFNRLRVGHILKFGGSTRLFVVQGPDEDQEPESEHTVTELVAQANEEKLKLEKLESGELTIEEKENVSDKVEKRDSAKEGIDWGMGEDAKEEDEDGEGFQNPFTTNEDLYLNDPKKTLKGWFEREGHDLPDYQLEEIKPGYFRGKVELPFVGSGGKPLICVVEHKGKKKDTVVQCALEACRILDRQGLLRQATHEGHQKKRKDWSENDYYDSDEDDFLDRTGDIERKRRLRKKESESAKGIASEVETYDSLMRQYSEIMKMLEKLERDLKMVDNLKREEEVASGDVSVFSDADELEAYMNHLSSQLPDKHKRIAWKLEAVRLKKEEARLRKLINVARPQGISELPERHSEYFETKKENVKRQPHTNQPSLKKKEPLTLRIHHAFLEEEEQVKPKLRKLNWEDDDQDVRPVPYSKPQKALDKYRALFYKQRKPTEISSVPPFPEPRIAVESASVQSTAAITNERVSVEETDVLPSLDDANVCLSEGRDCIPEEKVCLESTSKKPVVGSTLPIPEKLLEFAKPRLVLSSAKNKSKEDEKLPKQKKKRNPFDFEEKYETWIPPKDQTGDGRIALNDKLGY